MKKILLSIVAMLGLISAASAADMPDRSMAPAPLPLPPVFTWTGFYVGVHAGYVRNDAEVRNLDPSVFLPSRVSLYEDGWAAGAQAGYNLQLGQFVAGIETDIAYMDAARRRAITIAPFVTTLSSDIEYFGTVRGRIGMAFDGLLFFPHSMYFITGGLAYGEVSNRGSIAAIPPFPGIPLVGARSDLRTGYTLGFGSEHSLGNNITFKTDTLFYDLGDETVALTNGLATTRYRFSHDGWISRIGLNVRF